MSSTGEEWKREANGGEEKERKDMKSEDVSDDGLRSGPLLLSSLQRQSPEQTRKDEYLLPFYLVVPYLFFSSPTFFLFFTITCDRYHDVLDHLEQKYVASLHSINTLTGRGEAIQDSLQVLIIPTFFTLLTIVAGCTR